MLGGTHRRLALEPKLAVEALLLVVRAAVCAVHTAALAVCAQILAIGAATARLSERRHVDSPAVWGEGGVGGGG